MNKPCKNCTKQFEITEGEAKFHKRINVPSPTLCHACRQQRRMVWRNESTLFQRTCDNCKKKIIAAYPKDSEFQIFCYDCWWSDALDASKYAQDFDFNAPFFKQFQKLLKKVPRLALTGSHNENCDYVNYVNYSKDCYLCFGVHAGEKCLYDWRTHDCLECVDSAQCNDCKYCYECIDCDNCYNLDFSQNCETCSDSQYLYNCQGCSDCFLCVNLIHKKYHILNEKHTPEEYAAKLTELKNKPQKELEKMLDDLRQKLPNKFVNDVNCENCTGSFLVKCKNCQNSFSSKECEDCINHWLGERATDCCDCDMSGWPAEFCYEGISTCVNAYANFFSSLCWSCKNIEYCDSCFHSHDLFGCTGLKKNEFCVLNKQYSKEEYKKLVEKIIDHMKKTEEYGEFFPIEISPYPYEDSIAIQYYSKQ